MKKATETIRKSWNLQLFAEGEGADPEEGATTQTEQTEDVNTDVNTQSEPATNAEPDNEPKFTQSDVEKIIDRKLAQWNKQMEKENAKKAEANRLKAMNKEQTQAERISDLEAKIEELENTKALTEMSKNARAILSEKGINISDGLLSRLVTKDADETKDNVDEFVDLFNKAVAEEVRKKVRGNAPTTGSAPATLTKEDILKIENQAERQKKISENIHLFTGGN